MDSLDLKKFLYKYVNVRYVAILTLIGSKIYDITHLCFLDRNASKITTYDNLTNYYDDTTAGIKYYT